MDPELELLDASLPGTLPVFPGISVAGRYVLTDHEPVHRGDGMKVVSLANSRVALLIGDVVGSGALATTTIARLLTILRNRLQEGATALEAIQYADRYAASAPAAAGATAAIAVISLEDGSFEYAAAGHPPPLHWSISQARAIALAPSRPLGADGQGATAVGRLAGGEVLVMYTDGLLTAGSYGPQNAHVHLRTALATLSEHPEGVVHATDRPDEICELLLSEIVRGSRFADDVALLVAERTVRPPPLDATCGASTADIHELADELDQWLDDVGAGLLDHLALRQAFTELGNNAAQHAYGDAPDETSAVRLRAELSDTGVMCLEVRDTGRWQEPTDGAGRGLIIAGGLVDSLQLDRTAAGTTVTLKQELGRAVPVMQANLLPSHDPTQRTRIQALRTELARGRLTVFGDVEEQCATEFRNAVHEASRAGTTNIVVNLSATTLLASSAVRVLFDYMERATASGAKLSVEVASGCAAEQVLDIVDMPFSVI